LFVESNKDSLVALSDEIFIKDYKINQHRNNLMGELMGMDMCIEDLRKIMENPTTPSEKKAMNQLWNERDKIIKRIDKLEKKQKLLLSGKKKKHNIER
jgi:hypothetical protein